jgi:hypothetical protein
MTGGTEAIHSDRSRCYQVGRDEFIVWNGENAGFGDEYRNGIAAGYTT